MPYTWAFCMSCSYNLRSMKRSKMEKIRNAEEILSHGDRESRKIVLEIADKTLARLDSYKRIKGIAGREGSTLHIGTRSWDLSKKKNVYLLGAGKACNHMAMALILLRGYRAKARA